MAERSVVVRFRAEVAQFKANTQAASKTLGDFSAKSQESARKHNTEWDKVGRQTAVVGLAIGAGLGVAVSKFADFDAAMSQAAAGTNATVNELGALREAAIKAGADTQFSATQAANAITEMGKAGVSTKDILSGGLIGAMNLAAAGQLEVGQAAEIAATALTQFNLSGVQLTHVADLYAAAAGKAQGGVSDIALAMKYAGVTANSMGLSIEETTGTLALFASKGIIGEQAGTSFRSMLLSLTSPSKIAKEAMDSLGISMYDAGGKFVGIQGAADELQKRLGPLDEATRNQALGQIFGNESMNAAIALYQGGGKAVEEWTGKVNDAGFAQEQAAKLTDNLKGDLERLGGSLDTVFIQSGSTANGALRGLVQSLEDTVDAAGKMPAPLQAAGVAIGAATAAAALLGGGLLYLVPKAAAAKAAIVELGLASQATADKGFAKAGKSAKGLGIALSALTAIGVAGSIFSDDGSIDTDRLVRDLDSSTDKMRVLNEAIEKAGKSSYRSDSTVRDFGDALKTAFDPTIAQKADDILGSVLDFAGGKNRSAMADAAQRFTDIDAALTQMVSSGNGAEASKIYGQLANQAVRAGGSVTQLEDALPGYTTATQAASAATKEAADNTGKSAKAIAEAKVATDATSSAMLILGSNAEVSKEQIEDLAKVIQTDMDAASKAFTSATDVLGKFDPSSQAEAVAKAQKELDKAEVAAQNTRQKQASRGKLTVAQQQQLARAEQAIHDAVGKKVDQRAKAEQRLADLKARLADKGSLSVNGKQSIDAASQRVDDARKALADAQKAQSDASLENSYKDTLNKARAFTRDITEVTKRGLDPNTVARLLQEGPEQAGPALEELLGANSKNLIAMSNQAEAELRKINGSILEQSRLTSLALNSTTDQMGADLDVAFAISAAKAAAGGTITGEAAAAGIGASLPEVKRIAGEFGITLASVPPPPPIPLTVDTSSGKANLADLRQDLKNTAGQRFKTYLDVIISTERDRRQDAANSDPVAVPYGRTLVDPTNRTGVKLPPANALGTPFFRGGLSLVGEQGPEIVSLPRGAAVYSAPKSREIAAQIAGGVRVQGGSSTATSNHNETHTRTVNHYGDIVASDPRAYEDDARMANMVAF